MTMVKRFEKELPNVSIAAMIFAVLTVLFVYKFFFQTYWVPSGSMLPTLSLGEIVLSENVHDPSDVERGDIVSFDHDSGMILIKRLIGMPGDTIEVKDGVLYLNGEAQTEPYLREDFPMSDYGPYEVPEGHYFMMGDNRNYSSDSRVFGAVPYEAIRSKALYHYPSILRALLNQ